jgi:hypothetical protein
VRDILYKTPHHNKTILCRVLEIMKIDAQKDPEIFPEARHAKILVNQVIDSSFGVIWFIFLQGDIGTSSC